MFSVLKKQGLFSLICKSLVTLALVFSFSALLTVEKAEAANGDITIIITNELGAPLLGTSVNFACTGGIQQTVDDGGVGEGAPDAANNGTIRMPIATIGAGLASCDDQDAITQLDIVLDGYVTKAATGDIAVYDVGLENNNTTVGGVQFGNKVTVQQGGAPITGADVDAGIGFGTQCVEGGVAGEYFCPVPLAAGVNDLTARAVSGNTFFADFPADRIAAADAQQAVTITFASGGGVGAAIASIN